ncbi:MULTISPECIES: TetR family transcriptional regulator [Mycolicibacterium]|uniref:Transcriptional regulator, TetR family n=1 Tax=Mycolicibacterium vanbaalenii (strain DSM 7251 / JCM 13017 / BCRC 16820 / KCTC 9966 / NRRL B-24157 / PYR-1) TaxID=350058 RepID=A1TAJ0_MYCVP|nr:MULTISPECIES: TetR family transcriptional regulator [Mycolicibacterium]ABM14190.1 transcriptional regulator, TetR family [Mycolicibacterium vanbaalenii PYR-1]MCV7126759.1 TetR/AcrR family transcriptional regulator [Mycolicibacterium vanbaalenii PYR-1]PQP42189.1 TetR/AcrR family transcriptional regulator [Mycolicibacterium austroafricanum]QZT54728.1 TetR family transcriptional regulator [Mycolicibacterium austroafricanum]
MGAEDPILTVVVDLLENEGYDAVQLREVARRSRTSLTTIYKRYSNRDELILAALEAWTDTHRYAAVAEQRREPGETLHDALMRLFRVLFEPWERHPAMLAAYFRARTGPSGKRLLRRGLDVVVPAALDVLAGVDEEFIADMDTVIANVIYGLLGRFAAGEITITDILPAIDRTVYRLTAGYALEAAGDGVRRG